jgi:hypothetical protein
MNRAEPSLKIRVVVVADSFNAPEPAEAPTRTVDVIARWLDIVAVFGNWPSSKMFEL